MSATKEKVNNIEKYFAKNSCEKQFSQILVTVIGGATAWLLSSSILLWAIIICRTLQFSPPVVRSMRDKRQ